MQRMLASLEAANGNGTSMITLLLPPRFQLCRAAAKLTEELGTASNIKKTANRNSVKEAIVSAQQKLKLYQETPPNGLCVFVGTVIGGSKERRLSIGFEPLKPLTKFTYLCDKRFHVSELQAALCGDEATFGVMVLMGDGCTFGTLSGGVRHVLQHIAVELPNRHGRGGQSAPRFQRKRLECRAAYVKKVAELAAVHYLAADGSGKNPAKVQTQHPPPPSPLLCHHRHWHHRRLYLLHCPDRNLANRCRPCSWPARRR